MQVLWGILDMAECLALHGKDAGGHFVAPAVSLFKKLVFSNEAVQTSSSLAISSRLLQVPFPKQTMLGTDDIVENAAPILVPANVTTSATGNT